MFLAQLFLASFLCFWGCSAVHEKANRDSSFSIAEARILYDNAISQFITKSPSDKEKTNLFYRKSYAPIWNLALPTRSDEVASIDIPVSEERRYFVLSQDGQGFYLTRCHHSITIIKSLKNDATGVYNHFFIPFRDSRDKYKDLFKEELYRGFHTNGFREDFSGLEIYADMNGNIIKLQRYSFGKKADNLYYGTSKHTRERIDLRLHYYIFKAYGILNDLKTKDGSHYICPQCGCDLQQNESGYYYCSHCPWNELDFYNQEIEQSIIIGEGGGGGTIDPEDPENPELPDPNTGGGGSYNGSSGNNGNQGAPSNFSFDSEANQKVLPTLLEILDECVGDAIMDSIGSVSISFTKNVNLGSMMAVRVPDNDYNTISRIDYNLWGVVRSSILFEELIHCIQIINGAYHPNRALNSEIEAKFATYCFAYYTETTEDLFIPTSCSSLWWNAFSDYKNDPSEENYARMIDSVKASSPIYNAMSDNPDYHSMNNIANLFNCYIIPDSL